MDAIIARVLQRYSEVVPFRPRPPSGPTTEIGGKKYVLTDYSPFGGNELSDGGEGHARLIEVPSSGSKFKYLWAYDTDRKLVAAWRVTDGNEKAYGSAQQEMHHVVHLEKHGQLNRVTSGEFSHIEAEMRHREDENTIPSSNPREGQGSGEPSGLQKRSRRNSAPTVFPLLDCI